MINLDYFSLLKCDWLQIVIFNTQNGVGKQGLTSSPTHLLQDVILACFLSTESRRDSSWLGLIAPHLQAQSPLLPSNSPPHPEGSCKPSSAKSWWANQDDIIAVWFSSIESRKKSFLGYLLLTYKPKAPYPLPTPPLPTPPTGIIQTFISKVWMCQSRWHNSSLVFKYWIQKEVLFAPQKP